MSRTRSYLQSTQRWLSPGMGIKRWLLLLIAGAALVGMGLMYILVTGFRTGLLSERIFNWLMLGFLPLPWRIIVPLLAGGLFVVIAILRLGSNLLEPFRRPGDSLAASLYFHS